MFVLAYNLVGPNIQRAVRFRQTFPEVTLAVTADHPGPIEELSKAMAAAGLQIQVLLDLDVGMHRTGVAPRETAKALYEHIATLPGLVPGFSQKKLRQAEGVPFEFSDPDHERECPAAAGEPGGFGVQECEILLLHSGKRAFTRPGREHFEGPVSPERGGIDSA